MGENCGVRGSLNVCTNKKNTLYMPPMSYITIGQITPYFASAADFGPFLACDS
jgi:hypothetical protein